MTSIRPTRLWLLGAGPVGQHVARLAVSLEFTVTVIDERESLLLPEHFPPEVTLRGGNLDELLPSLDLSENDYVAIVMQVWQRDARALELLAERPLAYLGMIGCRRKLGEIYPPLIASGVSEAALAKVKAPIGINIGSKTAAEIAVSICAEMIAVRAGK